MTDHHPPSDLPVDLDALRRFHAGESDATEAAEISAWIAASARNRAIASALEPGVRDHIPRAQWNAREAYRTVMARAAVSSARQDEDLVQPHLATPARTLTSPGTHSLTREPLRLAQRAPLRSYRYVAVAAALLIAGFVGYRGLYTISTPFTTPSSQTTIAEAMTTQSGERAELTLRDGTQVVLAPGTKIRFDDNFGSADRKVFLDGEAVFTVENNTKSPFIVQTPHTQVTVLGTRFGVRSYNSDTSARVVVESGKVSVGTSNVLTAGSAAVAVPSGAVVLEPQVDVSAELAWTNGELIFENATVSDVLTRLSRWYGVTFQLDDTRLADTRVKVGFSRVDVQQAINILTTVLGVDATRSGRVVTLHARRMS